MRVRLVFARASIMRFITPRWSYCVRIRYTCCVVLNKPPFIQNENCLTVFNLLLIVLLRYIPIQFELHNYSSILYSFASGILGLMYVIVMDYTHLVTNVFVTYTVRHLRKFLLSLLPSQFVLHTVAHDRGCLIRCLSCSFSLYFNFCRENKLLILISILEKERKIRSRVLFISHARKIMKRKRLPFFFIVATRTDSKLCTVSSQCDDLSYLTLQIQIKMQIFYCFESFWHGHLHQVL